MKSLMKLLFEGEQKYEYGAVMLYFDFPELSDIQKQIDKKDVYTESGDRTFGLEDTPHTTLLYGLHDGVKLKDVKSAIDKFEYGDCILYNPSLFKNEDYDVLKFDIKGKNLRETNDALKEFPYTSDFPDYHPHSTIGYIKPGKGEKYTKLFKDKKYKISPKYVVYSVPSGEKHKITIRKKNGK